MTAPKLSIYLFACAISLYQSILTHIDAKGRYLRALLFLSDGKAGRRIHLLKPGAKHSIVAADLSHLLNAPNYGHLIGFLYTSLSRHYLTESSKELIDSLQYLCHLLLYLDDLADVCLVFNLELSAVVLVDLLDLLFALLQGLVQLLEEVS